MWSPQEGSPARSERTTASGLLLRGVGVWQTVEERVALLMMRWDWPVICSQTRASAALMFTQRPACDPGVPGRYPHT